MKAISQLTASLLSAPGFDKEAFENVHSSGEQVTSIRINPSKLSNPADVASFRDVIDDSIPWTKYGYYLRSRPSFTFDPYFHAGCYYVQEASSMFLEQALQQTVDLSKPLRILDLSAAPGGKSTHIQSIVSGDSLVVCNEVIRGRVNILRDNIMKWGCNNVMVTSNDPRDFASLENFFDVIVVDAPCSGSGLFRRDEEAMKEWSRNNVQLCSQRQQRILADVWPALKKDGILIYSTCSYSREEDEEILEWMQSQFSTLGLRLDIPVAWNILETTAGQQFGYRFWPYRVRGEGFFLSCLRKLDGESRPTTKLRNKPDLASTREKEILRKWLDIYAFDFIKNNNTVYAWPGPLVHDFGFLLSNLRVVYSGTIIGGMMRDKLVPDHALAMSNLALPSVPSVNLSLNESIDYLQRKDLHLDTGQTGWHLVKYDGYSLGWINVLPNRINNYYPKELRILKDVNNNIN